MRLCSIFFTVFVDSVLINGQWEGQHLTDKGE